MPPTARAEAGNAVPFAYGNRARRSYLGPAIASCLPDTRNRCRRRAGLGLYLLVATSRTMRRLIDMPPDTLRRASAFQFVSVCLTHTIALNDARQVRQIERGEVR